MSYSTSVIVQYPSETLARLPCQNSVQKAKNLPPCNRKHYGLKYPNHRSSWLYVITRSPLGGK